MRLNLTVIALCGLALAACEKGGALMHKDAPQTPSASITVNGQPAFVGRWAAANTACGHAAWTMTATRIQSPGALTCTINQASPTMAGYTVYSACAQAGAETPGRIVMTLSGGPPATAMTLTDGPFGEPTALVRCPA
jgi:hypothetical protein